MLSRAGIDRCSSTTRRQLHRAGISLCDGKEIIPRAGLEDHFCGKLLGLPMGVDVCYKSRRGRPGTTWTRRGLC